jgi:hypothetical protein
MLAGQLEDGIVVIKVAWLPAVRRMAGIALIAKRAAMRIGLAVAGGAVHGRAFEDAIHMTTLTSHRRMFAIEMEGEQGVIYCRKLPAFGRVTGGAVGSKLTVVMVIFLMAGETILGGRFQIMQVARSDMTLGTGYRRMFTNQIERHLVMVKAFAVRIHSIMTGHAICAEGDEMFGGKCLINLQVTIAACILIERRNEALVMAVFTLIGLMSLERESGCVVVESNLRPIAGIMTGGALISESAFMRIILGMTGCAIHGRAFEDTVDMAVCTSHRRMFAIEMEGKFGVIHIRGLPASGAVTTFALIAKSAVMRIVLGMTGGAVHRRAFEDTVHMTFFARHGCM